MAEVDFRGTAQPVAGPPAASLADILERVLDKGIVIAGDIKIDLLDIELLTIRLRLFVASVDTARKAGIDWWETDPALSSRAARDALREENNELRRQLEAQRDEAHRDEAHRDEDDESARAVAAPGADTTSARGEEKGSPDV